MDPLIWPGKSRTTSTNIHSTAMWGYVKTCQRRWTIGRSGRRGSGISVLAARPDDDDDGDSIFRQIVTKLSLMHGWIPSRYYLSCLDWIWEQWQWRCTLDSPEPHDWTVTIRLFCVISRTFIRGVLPICTDAVGVFYNSYRLCRRSLPVHMLFLVISNILKEYQLLLYLIRNICAFYPILCYEQ